MRCAFLITVMCQDLDINTAEFSLGSRSQRSLMQ